MRDLRIDTVFARMYKVTTYHRGEAPQMQGDPTLNTKTYTATEARKNFSDLFDAAHYGARVLVRKRDRCVVVISAELMERVEKLLQIEAALEAEAAQEALKEFQSKGGKTMEELAKELGID